MKMSKNQSKESFIRHYKCWYLLDIEEPTAKKYLTTGSEFEYIFETDGPGGFISCDVYRPGVKNDPLVIGSDKHVTRYRLLSLNARKTPLMKSAKIKIMISNCLRLVRKMKEFW